MALSHCCCRTTVQCQQQAVCNSQYMVTHQHWVTFKYSQFLADHAGGRLMLWLFVCMSGTHWCIVLFSQPISTGRSCSYDCLQRPMPFSCDSRLYLSRVLVCVECRSEADVCTEWLAKSTQGLCPLCLCNVYICPSIRSIRLVRSSVSVCGFSTAAWPVEACYLIASHCQLT